MKFLPTDLKRKRFLLFIILSVVFGLGKNSVFGMDNQALFDKINRLPGVRVSDTIELKPYKVVFELELTQPLDHQQPDGFTFSQRAFLYHRSFDAMTVVNTEGYGSRLQKRENDLAKILKSNYITIAHRFYPGAGMKNPRWKYLNIKHAADDHYRAINLLKSIYQGKWIATGRSKGGQSALFLKYYYPNAVDVTVAKVAPILLNQEDYRLEKFLLDADSKTCRDNIIRFQRSVLKNSESIKPFWDKFSKKYHLSFKEMGYYGALEFAVSEYSYYFRQYGPKSCSMLPGENATPAELFGYLSQNTWIGSYGDRGIESYGRPFTYQAYTQLGYYRIVTDQLRDLLKVRKNPSYRQFIPRGVTFRYSNQLMKDILSWLENKGNNIIYLYGEIDPYTVAAINPGPHTNSLKIICKQKAHRFEIDKVDEREQIISQLEKWLLIKIDR